MKRPGPAVVLILMLGSLSHGEEDENVKTARVCAVTQSWTERNRNLKHVLKMLDEAAAQRAEIVCLPQDCVPTDGGEKATLARNAIAKKAAGHKMYVAANLKARCILNMLA